MNNYPLEMQVQAQIEAVAEFIAVSEYRPEQIFAEEALEDWAERHGWWKS